MDSRSPTRRTQSLPVHLTASVETIPSTSGTLMDYPGVQLRPITEGDIVIAVMGATGSGKSSFINLATRQAHTVIGHDLESCTQEVRAISSPYPDGSGRNVVFVDTPGFDDTNRSDTDILITISDWLTTTYKDKIRLSGLLFLHRISDNRIAGTPLKNLSMFRELCGTIALQNVILTTTMWDDIDPTLGATREAELRSKYWKSMILAGSRIARFESTYESAWGIIAKFTGPRRALQLQVEMVDQGMALSETSAGSVLLSWLEKLIAQLREIIRKCEAQLRGISKDTDRSAAEVVIAEESAIKRELDQVNEQKRKLGNEREGRVRRRFLAVVRTVMAVQKSKYPPSNFSQQSEPSLLVRRSSNSSHGSGGSYQSSCNEERQGLKLAATITALNHASSVVGMAPIPCIKSAIDLVSTIVQSVQAMKNTEDALITLVENASTFIFAIIQQVNRGKISDDTKQIVEEFTAELQRLKNLTKRIAARGLTSRYIFQPADNQLVSSINNKIMNAITTFELRTAISMSQTLVRLEDLVSAILISRCDSSPLQGLCESSELAKGRLEIN